jgi:hypothetical protein
MTLSDKYLSCSGPESGDGRTGQSILWVETNVMDVMDDAVEHHLNTWLRRKQGYGSAKYMAASALLHGR